MALSCNKKCFKCDDNVVEGDLLYCTTCMKSSGIVATTCPVNDNTNKRGREGPMDDKGDVVDKTNCFFIRIIAVIYYSFVNSRNLKRELTKKLESILHFAQQHQGCDNPSLMIILHEDRIIAGPNAICHGDDSISYDPKTPS
jgi:hypothetical protein